MGRLFRIIPCHSEEAFRCARAGSYSSNINVSLAVCLTSTVRHFALGEIKAFLTLLLTYASIEAAPGTAWPELHKDKIGVGILDAVGDVTVIVNRRNH